jgi:hypothetical protein
MGNLQELGFLLRVKWTSIACRVVVAATCVNGALASGGNAFKFKKKLDARKALETALNLDFSSVGT